MGKEKWYSNGKAVSGEAVTPSDTELNEYDALYVGTGGELTVRLRDDSADITLSNIPNAEILPICVKYVKSTGTTASSIIGLNMGS